ncbi:pyocin knob domain-containing protein [Buttiauxella brennerae]|uniref:pyocin knob domain-containing protein n=1 Tax=Buttiauxella brennerae TaxID=82988 RepID=UPI00286EB6AC|nr:pyocin knob domain-containing protein [Buttiauxella brennerae]
MNQNKTPQSDSGHVTGAEQNAAIQTSAAKIQQMENARQRAASDTRRSSSQAAAINVQSTVTNRPPALYRVPKINVPSTLAECAKLIQSELQKIEQSQSILLTLWEGMREQRIFSPTLTSAAWSPTAKPIYTRYLSGADNLDTFTGAFAGEFMNQYDAFATPANNYPEAKAGALVVTNSGAYGSSCIQEYHPYSSADRFWRRVYTHNTKTWSVWCKFTGAATARGVGDKHTPP